MARKKSFKSIIHQIVTEILDEDILIDEEEEELDEMTDTGDIEGYETPNAFSGKGKKSKAKKKKISTNSTGFKYFKEDVYIGSLKNLLFEKEEKKGGRPKRERGDVWQRKSGAWAAKNSKGNVQSFKEKEAAETYAKGRQGQHGFRKKGEEKPKNGDGDDKPKNGDGDDKPKNGDDKPKKGGEDKPKKEKPKGSSMKSLFGKKGFSFKNLAKDDKFKSAIDDLESQVKKDVDK